MEDLMKGLTDRSSVVIKVDPNDDGGLNMDVFFDRSINEIAEYDLDSDDGGLCETDENHTHFTAEDWKDALEWTLQMAMTAVNKSYKKMEEDSKLHEHCGKQQ